MQRQPNELLISRELLEGLLARGSEHHFRVTRGPAPGARINHIRLHTSGNILVQYNQPVDEVLAYNAGRLPGRRPWWRRWLRRV